MTGNLRLTTLWLMSALAIFFAGTSFAQSPIQINGMAVSAGAEEAATDADGLQTIFSNLDPNNDPYNTDDLFAEPVVGKNVNQMTEQWDAVRFVPKVDVQARVLEAAVGYISGKRALSLSLYDNNDALQTPGFPLPGAQGITRDIPDLGECCQLAKVVLPQPVTLSAGTIYWLVASPGSKDFNGAWQISHLGDSAFLVPPNPWHSGDGEWPAARVRGTPIQTVGPINRAAQDDPVSEIAGATGKLRIFSNLDPVFSPPYTPGRGILVVGNDVPFYNEAWLALPFVPQANVQATTLTAAIARLIGTSKINLAIYSDDGGLPGTVLDGGRNSTTDIPDSGQCCDFATVRLPNVPLSAGVQYWVVASPSTDAEDFMGIWQLSTNNNWARLNPEQSSLWTDFTGEWLATQISGVSE